MSGYARRLQLPIINVTITCQTTTYKTTKQHCGYKKNNSSQWWQLGTYRPISSIRMISGSHSASGDLQASRNLTTWRDGETAALVFYRCYGRLVLLFAYDYFWASLTRQRATASATRTHLTQTHTHTNKANTHWNLGPDIGTRWNFLHHMKSLAFSMLWLLQV